MFSTNVLLWYLVAELTQCLIICSEELVLQNIAAVVALEALLMIGLAISSASSTFNNFTTDTALS